MKLNFDATGWLLAITKAVQKRGVTWKKVSEETGVGTTTLSRMKAGRSPDAASLAALSNWAGINPANFIQSKPIRTIKCPMCNGCGTTTTKD
jgi:transcriptional regulator with XRE-family HTH domain